MLSIFECDDSRKRVGNRWIPAFAGMTNLVTLRGNDGYASSSFRELDE